MIDVFGGEPCWGLSILGPVGIVTHSSMFLCVTETVGLVGPVHTVAVPVTHPLLGDTGPITAVELRGATTRLTSGGEAETSRLS